jgi:hypothetical protein
MSYIRQVIGPVCFSFGFAFLFLLLLVNWASGCGQQFPTASGETIEGECIGPREIAQALTE